MRLQNPSSVQRTEEVIAIDWKSLSAACPGIDSSALIIIDSSTGKAIPYQAEYLGQKSIGHLLVQVSIKPYGTKVLLVKKGKPGHFPAKTFCRYVPERKDDFAWENDKIAFRAYGKSLEHTNENAYGTDVWVKKTNRLVIDERYKKDDYHNDHGDGLDYYSVGFSLGAGDIAPFINDSIWYSPNYTQWKILDNGPIRSTFQLIYDEWMADSIKVKVVKEISIDAGTQLHKVKVTYMFNKVDTLPVVVGIVKRQAPGVALLDEKREIMAYWEPSDEKNGTTGVACVMTGSSGKMGVRAGQYVTHLSAKPGIPVIYYRGAAWDKAGEIRSAEDWFRYLDHFYRQQSDPVKITIFKDQVAR